MFIEAKEQPVSKSNFDLIQYYCSKNLFYEAFNYLNHRLYFSNDYNLYYQVLTEYLNSANFDSYNEVPMIITWTIEPKNVPFLQMVDPEIRLQESLMALSAWILDKSFNNIIVVDSSGYCLDKERLAEIGKQFGKNIEYHSFLNTDGVREFGKGYGEGEIVKYAIENSFVVKNSKKFVKMNGKQYVPFYEFLYMNRNGCFEFFNLQGLGRVAVDTRFYCVDTSYYVQDLMDIYKEVNDFKDNYLEHVFFEKTKNRINYYLPKEPIVFGKQGSTNKNYGDFPNIVFDFCNYLKSEII